jgi:NAD(P)-dependent dehydrogenase (short-subunit alcohol dehydrogenase family)
MPAKAADPLVAAMQAAVIGYTESLAAYLPSHFRVNCVEIVSKQAPDSGLDPELFPVRPSFNADDAARVVTYLLSSEAAAVNGQVFTAG